MRLNFFNKECKSLFGSSGIIRENSCLLISQQNRVVERKHIYIFEVARALRF